MRRLSLILVALALVAGVVAYAVDVNTGYPAVRITTNAAQYIYSTPTGSGPIVMPSAYTIYAIDQNDDFYIKRWWDSSGAEDEWIYVPAGQSLLFPAPGTYVATGNYRHTITTSGIAAGDTLIVLPWGK